MLQPQPPWLRVMLGMLATVAISATGALALYLVHRTMPELHPSFQARAPARHDTAAANRALPQATASHAAPPKAQPTSTETQQRNGNTRHRSSETARAPRS
ncbi:MAG: hypothetical protein J0H09_08460 [Burkholderiales bacterium]|nr:hypothetical protein [Burkholderiales bacterium]